MKDGFIKVAAVTPDIRVADTEYNSASIISSMKAAAASGAKVIAFPELSVTGYTCGDLFLQDTLLKGAIRALGEIREKSRDIDAVVIAGLPLRIDNQLYNVGAVLKSGSVLALVPKTHIPNYSEFYEARHFAPAPDSDVPFRVKLDFESETAVYAGQCAPAPVSQESAADYPLFGKNIRICCENMPDLTIGVEICEDLWVPDPPSVRLSENGATVIVNLSASDEITGKSDYRHNLVRQASASEICGYIYADAGEGESSTDLVFSGDDVIAENGILIASSERFTTGVTSGVLDLKRLTNERKRIGTFHDSADSADKKATGEVYFSFDKLIKTDLHERYTDRTPFVPSDKEHRDRRSEEILNLQAAGLKKRLAHTHSSHAVIGISGGLDSTLALLVTVRAFDMLKLDRKGIIAVTMPCFGTTDRTHDNACTLIDQLGVTMREIDIRDSVMKHFEEIGHDPGDHSVTYENVQARYRTLLLMNIANETGGLVIGTGDLSELALGWATYNGDHMSMYGVNCSVPKTLVRYLVSYEAEHAGSEELSRALLDILDTPVSPELLPPEDGVISQKTEDLVGPYELHDFFLYYCMRMGFEPHRIYRLALSAFEGHYDSEVILKWLKSFYRRFFAQQFKRSCLPDGPKVGSVALSPRGDWRMPSDASAALWLQDLESITALE